MSAIGLGAVRVARRRVAMCHFGTHAPQQTWGLLDHLVDAVKQRRWHGQCQRRHSLEIDHELELCGLIDRQIPRLISATTGIPSITIAAFVRSGNGGLIVSRTSMGLTSTPTDDATY